MYAYPVHMHAGPEHDFDNEDVPMGTPAGRRQEEPEQGILVVFIRPRISSFV